MPRGIRVTIGLLISSTALASTSILAQSAGSHSDMASRLDAIERALAERRSEIADLELLLTQLRNELPDQSPPVDATHPTAAASAGLLVDAVSLDRALANPNAFFDSLGAGDIANQVAAQKLNDQVSQPIFDRPNLPAGISAALTLGNASEASINYSHPILLRNALNQQGEFQPRVATLSVGIFTPLQSGVGTLVNDTEQDRYDRANRDIPTGTRVRIGFDFLSYPTIQNRAVIDRAGQLDGASYSARRRVVDILYTARQACLTHYAAPSTASRDDFYASYETPQPAAVPNSIATARSIQSTPATAQQVEARRQEVEGLCEGDNLARFIVGQRADATTPSGTALMNPALAKSFLGAFWDAGPQQFPAWGWGAAAELGTTDFAYRQANSIALVPDADAAAAGFPDRMNLSVDPAAGFAAPDTDSHKFWSVRGYGLFTLFRKPPRGLTPEWFFPGLTLVGSAEYSNSFSFRPGTTNLSICPAQPIDPVTMLPRNVNVRCRSFNTDAPVESDSLTLAAEARFRFLNVPLIRTLSFAPRYSHRLDDGAQVIDLPVYLQNDANGLGSAGLRFRHRWGGRDLLGNRDFSASEVVAFFVPLRFNGL